MNEQIRQKFCLQLGTEQVLFDEPMKKHTTFRIGGPADVFVMPRTIEEVSKALEICRQEQLPYFILGNGSNLLVSDQGYPGLIVSTSRFDRLETEGEILRAGSGVLLSRAASLALKCGLTGFEFAAGIPGTVGGACVMNAGAYGSETKDVLLSATVLTPEGQIKRIPAEELELGYRTSCIPGNGYVVLEAEYGDFNMLFTGDVEGEGEKLLEQGGLRRYDVLKVAHHGSKNSSSRAFLEQTLPVTAWISSGVDNRYGHPHEETVKKLEEIGSRIYGTQECGAVTLVTDGEDAVIETYLQLDQ